MKTQLTIMAILVMLCLSCYSFGQFEKCDIHELDSLIVLNESTSKRKGKDTHTLINELMKQCLLKDSRIHQDTLMFKMQSITSYEPIYLLKNRFDDYVDSLKLRKEYPPGIYFNGLLNNQKTLNNYMGHLIKENYVLYNYPDHSDQFLKSVHLYHANDVFLFSKKNKDRDYTGGFMFEFTTDRLKLRLLKGFINSNRILTYQSFFIGGEGYTPYIRFTQEEIENAGVLYEVNNGFLSDASLAAINEYMMQNQELSDRPFASFQYIGRAKYRMHHRGWIRSASFFKLGLVGKGVGENIQAVIHKDFTKGSQRVLNWDRQIAHGGRLAFNMEHKIDISFMAQQTTMMSYFLRQNTFPKIPKKFNMYLPIELAVGTVNTYWGLGIGFSTASFKDSNSHGDLRYENLLASCKHIKKNWGARILCVLNRTWNHTNITAEFTRRHVVHNSMLEGFGIINTWADDPLDDEAVTVYSLEDDEVTKGLYILNVGINVRLRKMSLYYKQTRLLNREFKTKNQNNADKNFQTDPWYGWGTIGFNIFM